ncbi:hypothetical protein COC42_17000 [Sphingomonas spermidinifaciens]|uniref:DUF6894 domain-containing protein n=1 Tax=Sphingomonas spermidinifaciens TaxID=1141889 RepID=A0A2A4B2E8_9SPHN|nr:hypothetical protein COC42_17000 [Sphingomonas spermidinifaciens]
MPVYYFRVRTADSIPHLVQNRDLPDLYAALAEGQRQARALLPRRPSRTEGPLRAHLDIEDECHRPVASLALADVARAVG